MNLRHQNLPSARGLALLGFLLLASGTARADQHLWHEAVLDGSQAGTYNAVIEIPKGSRQKYEVDKASGQITLDRVISGRGYPLKYGLFARTLGGDGDPLDVMVLGGNRVKPGAQSQVRIIGMMEMIDAGEVDHKVLAVDVSSRRFASVRGIETLPAGVEADVRDFFSNYKKPQGIVVTVGRFLGRTAAEREVRAGRIAYAKKFVTGAPKR